ncbi:MAG: YicC/YloC family endoribonuclease [Pseudomonadota bacterium]
MKSTLKSMTAFASAQGAFDAYTWSWELRSVNGKGLDLRLRVPDWIPGLEQSLKEKLSRAVARGNVTLNLKITREDGAGRMSVNAQALEDTFAALETVESVALSQGISLAPPTAADVLAMRGVMEASASDDNTEELAHALIQDLDPVIEAFLNMRSSEGGKLSDVLLGQIDEIEQLTNAAADMLETRRDEMEASFQQALSRVMDGAGQTDTARIAQEIALLAVKADVTEEIDRLHAHVSAARELVSTGSPMGRKLDFLAQEFNREANTLCSKAQHTNLTQIGLALKSVIDQMREQVQNVE